MWGCSKSEQYFDTPSEDHSDHSYEHDHTHETHRHTHDNHDHTHGHHIHDHDHDHHHSHHLENDGFISLSFASDRPFAVRKFQQFLDEQMPVNVFRAKGILWFEESPKRHVFHLSGKRFSLEDEDWKGAPKNQLVLIGQGLDLEQLRLQLTACLVDAEGA